MQAQHDIEHARFLRRELPVGAQHGQNGLRRGLTRDETMHDHGLVVVTRADRVVRQHHDAGETGDKGDSGADFVLDGSILGVFVVGVQKQDGSSQHVHDVGRGVAHDHGRSETIRQLALGIDGGDIVGKLLLRGKLAHQQQIGYFFVVEPAIFRVDAQKVVQVVPAQAQLAFIGAFLAIGHDVAMHVGDARQTRQNTGSVGIAQAALHIVAFVLFSIDRIDALEILVQVDFLRAAHYAPFLSCHSFPPLQNQQCPRWAGIAGCCSNDMLFCSADTADGGAAVRALALRDRLAVLRDALNGILHDLLRLAFHAICLDSHSKPL